MSQPSRHENKEKSPGVVAMSLVEGRDLFARTLRTVAVLVGACILFVGVLSVTAVAITNKAIAPSAEKAGSAEVENTKNAAPKKPVLSPARGDVRSHPI